MSSKHKVRSNQSSGKYIKSKYSNSSQSTNIWLLLPIIFIISVLPFVTRLKEYKTNLSKFTWFTYNDLYVDFFLYYKQSLFLFAVFIMAAIALYKAFLDKKKIVYSRLLIPLSAYAVLALLSSIISKYRSYSFKGVRDHFESVFVLLGYCLIIYYCLQIIETENDIRLIINCFVISIIVMSLLGVTQYIGKDFFASDIGLKMILPKERWSTRETVKFNFETGRVYLSFYNPNYVGSYAAMAIAFLLVLAVLTRKRRWMIPIYLVAAVGMSISLIGSKSKTGLIALAISLIFALIILSKYLIKYFYLSIPIFLLLLAIVVLYNKANNNFIVNQLKQAVNFTKYEPPLKDIITGDDEVIINYNNNKLHVSYEIDEGYGTLYVLDDGGNAVNMDFLSDTNDYIIQDERFTGFRLGFTEYEDIPLIYIKINNKNWFFTNQTDDGSYYYLNLYGKLDKIITAPHALFSGYERYASGRGYIWSRTLPLLKKYIILGSGADTYVMAFPQQDYVGLYNYGYGDNLVDKPHNMYLQIGVQTGVLSLIAFLVFYAMYFISSIRLYIKCKFSSYYAQVGVAILVATVAYMVLGIANDSTLTVAPVFWVLLGLGIASNRLAKQSIEDEIAGNKANRNQR